MATDPNELAYPMPSMYRPEDGAWMYGPHFGLTKREAFAMAAMQGLASNFDTRGLEVPFSRFAVAQADALIAALNEVKE